MINALKFYPLSTSTDNSNKLIPSMSCDVCEMKDSPESLPSGRFQAGKLGAGQLVTTDI